MNRRVIENFFLKGTDWLFRATSPEALLLKVSGGILIAVFGGTPLIALILQILLGAVPEGYIAAQKMLNALDILILVLCALLFLVAVGLIIQKRRAESNEKSRKHVVVVEGRGLRDDDGSALDQVVAESFEGKITPILLDLRNRMDGKVIAPEQALDDIQATHRALLQHRKGLRSDLTTVYGGLTSVPYTFLTGLLLDDEGRIVTYDWDRSQETWRALDDVDDGASFVVSGISDLSESEEVVVALAFSYPIADTDLRSTFEHQVVKLTLDGMSSDSHWSQTKQSRLAQQFLEVIKEISAFGVKRIHLVMAAPNSAVFTFGRRYDKRNLPELIVYQFERGSDRAYPWGILMPVSGVDRPHVLYSDGTP